MDAEAGKWYRTRLVAQDAVQNVLQNPTGKPCAVGPVKVHVITGVGSLTADIGIHATSETTDDTLIDAADLGTDATLINNEDAPGSNGLTTKLLAANAYVTCDLSAAGAGLVADVYVFLQELKSA